MWLYYYFTAHFLLYIFANKLLLAVYFICILDYGNDVRQKANLRVFFLIRIQNGSSCSRDNSQNSFGPGTANEHTV